MDRPNELKRVLAEEIRAAIAESEGPLAGARLEADPATADARGALRRAAEVMTPSVPAGAPLGKLKALAIRGLRFLWRNQSTYNSLSLAAAAGLADAIERFRADFERRADELSRRLGVQEARLTLAEGAPATRPAAPTGIPVPSSPPLPAGVYALFEERFRGRPADIEAGQRPYLDLVREAPGPVLDVGCGRGEFLRLLGSAGIPGSGVEANPVSVQACRAEGLSVEHGDALEVLSRRPAGGLGAVVAFQVVEHWPVGDVFRFLQEARRCLAPGGLLVAETINADSVSAMRAFYLDPSHVRPVPPAFLKFLAEAAGFVDVRVELRSELPASERLEERSDNERKLNALLFAPQDYAVIGRAPAAP
jgi:SAM-dependent methyltransferase